MIRTLWDRMRGLEPATWLVVLAILVRIDVALRYDVNLGYDAYTHMAYTDFLARGRIPRLWFTDLGYAAYGAHHPPLFYALALAIEKIGLGKKGAVIISVLSGAARLILADRLFKGPMAMTGRARFFANAILGFIPFALRIDVFYSNESLSATLALAAISLAIARRPKSSGVVLGIGFLTKASTVAAVPGIIVADLFGDKLERRFDRSSLRALLLTGAISAFLLLLWAYPNLAHYQNPYPTVYQANIVPEVGTNPAYKEPILMRHGLDWYLPSFTLAHIRHPYYGQGENLIRTLHYEAWGDYYNFLHRDTNPPQAETVNGKQLMPAMKRTHIAFGIVGLLLQPALLAGMVDAVRRLRRKEQTNAEVAVASMGFVYLLIAVLWAAAVPFDYHGAIKSTYALGAVVIHSVWTARGLDLIKRPVWLMRIVEGIALCPIAFTLWQRIVW